MFRINREVYLLQEYLSLYKSPVTVPSSILFWMSWPFISASLSVFLWYHQLSNKKWYALCVYYLSYAARTLEYCMILFIYYFYFHHRCIRTLKQSPCSLKSKCQIFAWEFHLWLCQRFTSLSWNSLNSNLWMSWSLEQKR